MVSLNQLYKSHFINTQVGTSHESNTCFVFGLHMFLCVYLVCVALQQCNQLNAEDVDMEKVCFHVTTKVLLK